MVNIIAALLSITSNGLSWVIASLKSILHLTLCWLSSSTLFVAPTLVVSVTSKSYLCKLIVIVHGPLGQLLLSVTTPC
jgi:hypothetical protein